MDHDRLKRSPKGLDPLLGIARRIPGCFEVLMLASLSTLIWVATEFNRRDAAQVHGDGSSSESHDHQRSAPDSSYLPAQEMRSATTGTRTRVTRCRHCRKLALLGRSGEDPGYDRRAPTSPPSAFESLRARSDEIAGIVSGHQSVSVSIFVFVATGRDQSDSDIDFLVRFTRAAR